MTKFTDEKLFRKILEIKGRFQWPRGLRRGSAAARLLGLWDRIPPGARRSACCVCYHVEVTASGISFVQRRPTECSVSACDSEASRIRGPWPTRVVVPCREIKKIT